MISVISVTALMVKSIARRGFKDKSRRIVRRCSELVSSMEQKKDSIVKDQESMCQGR